MGRIVLPLWVSFCLTALWKPCSLVYLLMISNHRNSEMEEMGGVWEKADPLWCLTLQVDLCPQHFVPGRTKNEHQIQHLCKWSTTWTSSEMGKLTLTLRTANSLLHHPMHQITTSLYLVFVFLKLLPNAPKSGFMVPAWCQSFSEHLSLSLFFWRPPPVAILHIIYLCSTLLVPFLWTNFLLFPF